MTAGGVIAEMENFYFDLSFTIKSFEITANINGTEVSKHSNSNKTTVDQMMMLKLVKPGTKVYIENIRAEGPDGTIRNLSPISIKVI